MGILYSKKKKKAKFNDTDLPSRPIFRRNENGEWIKRIVPDGSKCEKKPDFLKETVLDKDWTDIYEEIPDIEDNQELLNLKKAKFNETDLPHRCYSSLPYKTNPPDISLPQSTKCGEEGSSEAHSLYGINEKVTEDKNECLEYREKIEIFTPLIVQNVLIHDILPHLPFLDNHDDIYEEMKHRSQKDAVVSLLNELNKSQERGKWHKFMNALNACGYTYIVDNITGYTFIKHRYQTEYIKKITPVIGKMISPPELMPFLMANELLSNTDKDNILCECNNRGDYAGAVLLLDRLPRKHRNWYMLFITALEEAKYEEVAANLQIKELMQNRRVKDGGVHEISTSTYTQDIEEVQHTAQRPQLVPPSVYTSINKKLVLAREKDYYLTPQSDDADVEAPTEKDECKTKFSELEKELNKLEQEAKDIGVENSLLEKISDLHDDVINSLEKRRQLCGSIAEKEKKRMELHASPATDEENQENQCFDWAYYFGVDKSRRSLLETTAMVDIMGGVADWPQPHRSFLLDTANIPPPHPIYRINFDKKYLLSVPIDSGFGYSEYGSDFTFAM